MPQHFLLSSEARSLSLTDVFAMDEVEIEATFRKIRWADANGEPVCPKCDTDRPYNCPRSDGAARFRCRCCQADFSITSGTLFSSHKRSLRTYLVAIVLFCNEHRGKSMLGMSRDLGLSYKAAFVLSHKIREAIAGGMKGQLMGGQGKTVEIDGAYFGGYVKPANIHTKRIDRRLTRNLSGKRKSVIVVRDRNGGILPAVFPNENRAARFLMGRILPNTVVHADEAAAWDPLHAMFKMKRINHRQAYSVDGACTNAAEGYFARLRRAEAAHGHIAGPYLLRYAQEAAFREDNRRICNGDLTKRVLAFALKAAPSIDFCGYWQRRVLRTVESAASLLMQGLEDPDANTVICQDRSLPPKPTSHQRL